MVATEKEILNDSSIQLVLSSQIASERAPLGIKVMKHGKDYLSDKPGITTLEQLADVRKTIAETKRLYAIMYSERLEVKAAVNAGKLVQAGAIGKVIQTINIAPHQVTQKAAAMPAAARGRPDWFWNPDEYGGILCDIGSHQVDQFLYYTGSKRSEVVESQIANVASPRASAFPGLWRHGAPRRSRSRVRETGLVHSGWSGNLGRWPAVHSRNNGYIEVRKYTDVAVKNQGNNLFIVDGKEAR